MNTLVICKIADPRLKRNIQSRLLNHGFAIAPGIFECDYDSRELTRLQNYLERLPYASADSVILFPICATCQQKRLAFGSACKQNEPETPWVIL